MSNCRLILYPDVFRQAGRTSTNSQMDQMSQLDSTLPTWQKLRRLPSRFFLFIIINSPWEVFSYLFSGVFSFPFQVVFCFPISGVFFTFPFQVVHQVEERKGRRAAREVWKEIFRSVYMIGHRQAIVNQALREIGIKI